MKSGSAETCTATLHSYVLLNKTTNPNVSPIGKRFEFETDGASDGT